MKHSVDVVADNLRALREERNLSLEQLAVLTGVSKSMLRQIETGKSSPTIATIWKIANGLRVSFTSLLSRPNVEAQVRSFTGAEPLTGVDGKYRLFPLVPFDPDTAFETYYVEIDPGTVFSGEPHDGNVHEYLYVLKGKMQITVAGQEYLVSEQEFLQFFANCPHEYKNVGRKTATAIMQVTYR